MIRKYSLVLAMWFSSGASCQRKNNGKCAQSGGPCAPNAQQTRSCSHDSTSRIGQDQKELRNFWNNLSTAERKKILRVEKKDLFKQIRCLYCSRCYGLFQLRCDDFLSAKTLTCFVVIVLCEIFGGIK